MLLWRPLHSSVSLQSRWATVSAFSVLNSIQLNCHYNSKAYRKVQLSLYFSLVPHTFYTHRVEEYETGHCRGNARRYTLQYWKQYRTHSTKTLYINYSVCHGYTLRNKGAVSFFVTGDGVPSVRFGSFKNDCAFRIMHLWSFTAIKMQLLFTLYIDFVTVNDTVDMIFSNF